MHPGMFDSIPGDRNPVPGTNYFCSEENNEQLGRLTVKSRLFSIISLCKMRQSP